MQKIKYKDETGYFITAEEKQRLDNLIFLISNLEIEEEVHLND